MWVQPATDGPPLQLHTYCAAAPLIVLALTLPSMHHLRQELARLSLVSIYNPHQSVAAQANPHTARLTFNLLASLAPALAPFADTKPLQGSMQKLQQEGARLKLRYF